MADCNSTYSKISAGNICLINCVSEQEKLYCFSNSYSLSFYDGILPWFAVSAQRSPQSTALPVPTPSTWGWGQCHWEPPPALSHPVGAWRCLLLAQQGSAPKVPSAFVRRAKMIPSGSCICSQSVNFRPSLHNFLSQTRSLS